MMFDAQVKPSLKHQTNITDSYFHAQRNQTWPGGQAGEGKHRAALAGTARNTQLSRARAWQGTDPATVSFAHPQTHECDGSPLAACTQALLLPPNNAVLNHCT